MPDRSVLRAMVLLSTFLLLAPSPLWRDALADASPPPSVLSPTADCGQQQGGTFDYKYCIYRTPGSTSSDVLWFLHGRGGSEHSWDKEEHYKKIRAAWASRNEQNIPTVVAVSFGPEWLLTRKLSKPKSGMLDFFEASVIPTLEKQLGRESGRRLLLGESMGGFGAAQLVLSQGARFDRAVLGCPALAWLSPYAKFADIVSWASGSNVNLLTAFSIVLTTRGFYASTEEWEKDSPLYAAKDHLGRGTPPMLISIGQEDTYGFFPGARDFMSLAKAESGSEVAWQLVHGPHCSFDEDAAATFLLASD